MSKILPVKNYNKEYVELLENEFYKIIFLASKQKSGLKWLARVRVIRRDTMEFINAGFTLLENDEKGLIEQIKKKVSESLFPALEKAGKPSDWDSENRKILVNCKALKRKIIDFGGYSIDHLSEKKESDEYLTKYAIHWKEVIKETIGINKALENLDDKNRLELLTISDTILQDPSDAWSLDDIDSRILIFDFFSCPTPKEIKHHALQKDKITRRFEELGWKDQHESEE